MAACCRDHGWAGDGRQIYIFRYPLTCGLLILFSIPHPLVRDLIRRAIQLNRTDHALPWFARNTILMEIHLSLCIRRRYWTISAQNGMQPQAPASDGPLQIFLLPLNTLLDIADANFFDGRMGPLFLILAPLLLDSALAHARDSAQAGLVNNGVFSALSFAAWTWRERSSALWQARLLFPMLMTCHPHRAGWDALINSKLQNYGSF